MNTNEPIEAFNRDLTLIINGQAPASDPSQRESPRGHPAPAADAAPDRDYQGLLELAQTMADVDLSAASQIRYPLRRRLLTEIAPQIQGVSPMRKPFWRGRKLAAIAASLAVLAVLTLSVPPLRAIAREVLHQIGLITITNDPSSAQEFLAAPETPGPVDENEPTVAPPPASGSPNIPQPEAYVPRFVPDGYGLQHRNGRPTYILAGSGDRQHESYFTIYTADSGRELAVGDAPVVKLTVRGVSGAFIQDAPLYVRVPDGVERATKDQLEIDPVNLLLWDEDGATVIIESNALGQADLLAIAESLTR